jgi:hypothetical protein
VCGAGSLAELVAAGQDELEILRGKGRWTRPGGCRP